MIEVVQLDDAETCQRRLAATEGRSFLVFWEKGILEFDLHGEPHEVQGPAIAHRSPVLGLAVRSWPPGPLWLMGFDGPDAEALIDLAFVLLCPMTGMVCQTVEPQEFTTVETLLNLMRQPNLTRELRRSQAELLLRYLSQFNTNNPARQLSDNELVVRFVRSIDRHHGKEHRVTAYAQRLGVTIRTLNRVFRASTGITPKASLQYRLNLAAKRQLQQGGASVKEISYRLGFTSPVYFHAFFRRSNGITPKQYADRSQA